MPQIIEKELCYEVTGHCFKVHKKLGRFCRERQYADELELLFKEANLEYGREFTIQNLAPDSPKGNIADFIVKKRLLIDLKAKNYITKRRLLSNAKISTGFQIGNRTNC